MKKDPKETKAKSSFFNWWYFRLCLAVTFTLVVSTYIQDNLSWGIGFGIPCLLMAFALALFLLGTMTYRFSTNNDKMSPFTRIGWVFVKAARNWRTNSSAISIERQSQGIVPYKSSQQFKFLNKALAAPDGLMDDQKVCSINEVEEERAVLRLFPIWISCLVYRIVYSQS